MIKGQFKSTPDFAKGDYKAELPVVMLLVSSSPWKGQLRVGKGGRRALYMIHVIRLVILPNTKNLIPALLSLFGHVRSFIHDISMPSMCH